MPITASVYSKIHKKDCKNTVQFDLMHDYYSSFFFFLSNFHDYNVITRYIATVRMKCELTEGESFISVYEIRAKGSVRRLWERCHLRVLIHDGIILFQGNFWAFLRGAALMRSSNLRSPSNPDFPLCSRGGVLLKIIFHSIVDFLVHREPVSRLSFPPFFFLFSTRAISKRERSRKRENEHRNQIFHQTDEFPSETYSHSIRSRELSSFNDRIKL